MKKRLILTVIFLFLFQFPTLASTNEFQNSCRFSFSKAVFSITPYCALNFYEGEIILTYGDAPIGDTATCTADRDIGPMGWEEADLLVSELTPKIFDESNKGRMSSQLLFSETDDGLEGRLSMFMDGDELVGDLMITKDQISDGTIYIGAATFKLTSPQSASFVEEALKINLKGDCTGPYFDAADQPGDPIIALSNGEKIKKGDTVLQISQIQDPSSEEFLGAIENAIKSGRNSVLLLILRDDEKQFVVVDVEEVTSLFFPAPITFASSLGQNSNNIIQENASDSNQSLPGTNTQTTTGVSSEQRKLALLIGNAEYLSAPLDNPVNDARLIGNTLKSLGFEVYIQENADQKTMKRAIRDFGEKLESAGGDAVGFFYFSGHGLQSEGENYLQPIGAEVRGEADVEIEMVSANAILKQMEFARNGLNIVVLDACRTNPFSRGFRSPQNGLVDMAAPTGSILAYATAPGTVAYDGRGDNSPYAGALAEAMLMPNTPVETVFKTVRISVMDETDEKQVPWESSSLIGNFMFNPD